jgi:uncharacterized protein (TIRG00374 family)
MARDPVAQNERRLRVALILGSIFVERLVDLLAVLVLFGAGLAMAGIHNRTIDRVAVIGVSVFLAASAVTYLGVLRASRGAVRSLLRVALKGLPERLSTRVIEIASQFGGLVQIVTTPRLVAVLLLSVPIWMLEAASLFCICRAVGFGLDPGVLMLLVGGASLSTLFPTAPGFAGSYQFAFVVILRNFGVPDTLALVAATGAQVYLMGVYALAGVGTGVTKALIDSWFSDRRIWKPTGTTGGQKSI